MDIQELQSFRLSDAVKFNDKLNPRLWGSDEHLLPDVREKLMAIADDFREFLGISDLEIKDITVSGSNAAYTYTPHSDIDLHLVVDLPKADVSEVYRELFDAKKYQYNDQHDYKIGNYDIELYVQDANKPHHSQGIYSVLNNEWVRVPSRRTPKVDDISVKSKFEDIGRRIEQAVASGNKEQMDAIAGKIKNMRQAGLDSTGEFGPENLAFKALRTQGLLDQLSQARAAAKDAELSITERKKDQNKKPSRWGNFGGMWFPGFHNYGQATTEIGDGDTDGGGESVAEDQKPKDIKDILPPFVKSCAQYLGLEKTPKIILKRDPEWTRRNGTFGRFDPDTRSVTLAVSGRHTLDILRTLAHELTHARQDELATMPVDAGATGSPYEDDANAQAGRIMRYWVDKHPEFFKDIPLEEDAEQVNEAFDQPYFTTWEKSDYGDVDANAKLPDGSWLSIMFNKRYNEDQEEAWSVEFWRNNSQEVTGEGDAQRVFATVLHAIQTFIKKYEPNRIIFTAVKEDDSEQASQSRARLYDSLVQRYAKSWGYRAFRTDTGNKVIYELSRIKPVAEAADPDKKYTIKKSYTMSKAGIEKSVWYIMDGDFVVDATDLRRDARYYADKWNAAEKESSNASQNPHKQGVQEATGFIPVDSKLAHDPRYVSGLTVDIKPGETQRQAKKLGWKIDKNGSPPLLMQELERQWKVVKESREELDEINMRPSNLKQLSSDVAGAQAGMEFEMIVPDVEGNDDYDEDENAEYESDYEYNTDANDIEQIVEFFNNEEINSYYSIKTLRLKLSEAFDEWKLTEFDNRWRNDPQELVYDYIKDNLSNSEIAQVLDMEFDEDNPPDIGRTEYNLAAEKIVDEQIDPYYEDAEIDARDVFMSDDDLESEWLQSEGYETMQDIESNFDINWPHQNRIDTSDGPGSQSIKDVALNFMNYMGFETIAVGSRYHDSNYEKYNPGTDDWEDIGSDKPLDSYTIEPDGSLTARSTRDRGLEFVSPPMPLDKMLDNLNRVKAWAKKEGCYTGKDAKTGLHINVSVPGLKNTNTDLDYVKLALLLGDEYVSKEFGRLGEHYAQSALKKVKEAAARDPAKAAEMLNIMRGQMSKLASKIIQSSKVDKFTTIHPKEGYVEFRSPGGDWLDANFSKIEPTLMRFIVALDAAAKPESYREEYLKKLYRLLDPEGGESKGLSGTGTKDTVRYFADFVAGKTPQAALRSFIKQAQLERKLKRGDSEGKKYWWKVSNPGNSNASIEVVALSKNEAIEKAIGPDGYPSWSSNINSLVAKPLRPYEEQSVTTPKYEIYNKQTGNSVEDAEGITNDAEALVRLNDYIEHGPHALQRAQATAMFGIRTTNGVEIVDIDIPMAQGRAATSPTGQWKMVDGLNRELYRFRPAENTRERANYLARVWADTHNFDGNYQVEPAEESSTPASDSTATSPRLDRPFVWKVQGTNSGYQRTGVEVVASSEFEAMQKARREWNLNTSGQSEEEYFRNNGWIATPVRPAPAPGSTTDLAQQRATPGTFTGAWKVTVDGDEVYRFSGIGNNQTDANRVGREWARNQISQGLLYPSGDIEVVPIMT